MTRSRTLTDVKTLLLSTALAKATGSDDDSSGFKALSTASAIGAGIATRAVLKKVWAKRTGTEPPADPADPSVGWREALSWAASAGVAVGVGRVVGRRLAASAWERTTGDTAPATRDLAVDDE